MKMLKLYPNIQDVLINFNFFLIFFLSISFFKLIKDLQKIGIL